MRSEYKYAKSAAENAARREELYKFLLSRGEKWTSMERCTDTIRLYPAYFRTTYHNSSARRMLTHDIEAINADAAYEKIIISGSHGIKLATQSEFDKFVASETKEIFLKLRRLRGIMRKGSVDQMLDLQGKITEAFVEG